MSNKNQIYISQGNSKIDRSCLIFNLPTAICNGEHKQCKKCYALKAERNYPPVLPCRTNNFNKSKSNKFVKKVTEKLKKTSKKFMRIHEAGDFYSQIYIDKWKEIIQNNPEKMFFAFTKKYRKFDFSEIEALPNFNLIISNPDGIKNYGSLGYCEYLVETHGFFLCPDGVEEGTKCMKSCFKCFSEKKVCFIEH